MHKFKPGDFIAIAAVLLLAAVVFLLFVPRQEAGGHAEIYQNGQLIRTLSLADDGQWVIEGAYRNIVTVSGGKIAITDSDCPGEDCVHSGWIHTGGRSIVCLPNGVEIRIVSDADDVDFVVG